MRPRFRKLRVTVWRLCIFSLYDTLTCQIINLYTEINKYTYVQNKMLKSLNPCKRIVLHVLGFNFNVQSPKAIECQSYLIAV